MDYAIFFALLLYINVFYFGLYAFVEFFLLVFKIYKMSGPDFSIATIINEMFVLAFLVVVESGRLLIGQSHEPADFDRQLQKIFWILGLTVPSVYSVWYFTFWQTYVTRLDRAFGMILLLIQGLQFLSAMLHLWPRFRNPLRRTSEPHPYSRL